LSWNPSAGAVNYRIYFEKGNNPARNLAGTVAGTVTAYTHEGLDAGTEYHYFITAANAGGESEFSLHFSAKTMIPGPTGVAAAGLTISSIRITWTAVTGAASYKVYSAVSATAATNLIETVTDTSYTHTGLSAGTLYYYWVKAVIGADDTAYSLPATARVLSAPPAPTDAAAALASASSINITWSPVNGAASYKIYYATTGTGSKNLIDTITAGAAPAYIHTGLLANTTYYYFITAVNNAGESEFSAAASAKTPAIPEPTGVLASALSTSSIQISWSAVSGANTYKVYCAPDAAGTKYVAATVAGGISYTHTGLLAGTTYYYFITAVGSNGESDYSAAASAITFPGAPAGGAASAQSADSIRISWSAATGAASYRVYFAASETGSKTLAGTAASGTSYTHTGLAAGTTYYYFITAVNASGESDYSAAVSAKTLLAGPTGVTAVYVSNTIQISWNVSVGATSYRVYSATSGTGEKNLITTVTAASYTHAGLQAGTTYYYWITAFDGNAESDYSQAASALTIAAIPTGTAAAALGTNSISISWTAVAGAASYKVYTAASETGSKTLVNTVTSGNSYTHTGLLPGTAYIYFVTAVNSAGESDYSAAASAKTLLPAPTGVTAAALSANSISIAWAAAAGATGYRIYYAASGTGEKNLITTTGETTHTHTGLQAGTTYYYWIRAYDGSTESDYSAQVSALTMPAVPVVTAAAISASSITVSWGAVAGAASYTVAYAASETGNKEVIASGISGNSYTHTGLLPGTVYCYFVRAVNASGQSDYSGYSDYASAATKALAPTGITAAALSASEIQVSWNAVSGAVNYKVYFAASSSGMKTQAGTAATTTYTHTGLTAGTTYYYFIIAVTGVSESDYSVSANAITAPGVPTNLRVTTPDLDITATSVYLRWNSVTGATSYKVYSAFSADGEKTLVVTTGNLSSPSYTHTGMLSGTTYYYFVTASNGSGEGAYSAYLMVTTKPAAPTGVTATAQSTTSIQVTWNAVAGATSYKVYFRRNTQVGLATQAGTVTAPAVSYTHTGLTAATYNYYIVTVTAAGESDYSAYTTAASMPTMPAVPSGVGTDSWWDDGGFLFHCLDVTAATGYKVYSSTVSASAAKNFVGEFSAAECDTAWNNLNSWGYPVSNTSTYFWYDDAIPGTTYYVWITAVNKAGESGFSPVITKTSGPAAPTGVTAAAQSATSVRISWSAVSGATSYKVWRILNNGDYSEAGTVSAPTTNITLTDLTSKTTYKYEVQAVNANGYSYSSATVTVTTP
jgi:fibronectin type 3 domain-containing protein